jgi:hypothetical protein
VRLIAAVRCDCLSFVKAMVRAALEVFRLTVARESLDAPRSASDAPERRSRPGILHVLFFSREPLGEEPAGPARPHRPLLRWLLAPEQLPYDPVPPEPPHRRGRLAALLAPEHLDDDSP